MTDTATQLNEDEKPQVFGGENALETEMTDAELEAFVDKTLGVKPKEVAKDDTKDGAESDKNDKPAVKTGSGNDTDQQGDGGDGKDADKKPEADKLVEAEGQQDEAAPVEIPAVDLSDLFVEIEAYIVDDKGENPQEQTIRLNVGESIPENARFKNDKQLYELLEAQTEMKQMRDKRNAEYESKQSEQEQLTNAEASQKATLESWDAEIAELIEDGAIPAPKFKPGDDGFMADPSTILVDNVFKFMKIENDKRKTDGKRPIASFESAFNKYNKQEDVKAKAEADAKEAELVKARGSKIGGGSPSSGSGATAKIYKAGSAKSIYDIDTSDL